MTVPRSRFVRLLRARPRLLFSAATACAVAWLLPVVVASHSVTRALVAWNVGTCLYVLLAVVMMLRSSEHHIRYRAQLQDDGRMIIIVLVVVSSIASLAAIAGQLALAKDLQGLPKYSHIALAVFTVVSSWAFIQVMFTLHYAHEYYAEVAAHRPPPLQFPTAEAPTYGDFFYFAAVIGTSGQTADVAFTGKALRRVGTMHCILAYLFNTTVLALLLNVGAGVL